MFKQTISLTTLAAFVIYSFGLSGCSSVFTRPAEEIRIAPPTKVAGYVTKNGERVTYDAAGGRIDTVGRKLEGNTTGGDRIKVSIDDIDSVFYTDWYSQEVRTESAATLCKQEEYNRKHRLKGDIRVIFSRGETIRFLENTSHIDSLNQAVTGLSGTREIRSVPISEIDSLMIRQRDRTKTALVIGGTVAFLTIAFRVAGAYTSDRFSWEGGWSSTGNDWDN